MMGPSTKQQQQQQQQQQQRRRRRQKHDCDERSSTHKSEKKSEEILKGTRLNEKSNLHEMKEWINSLTSNELLQAMSFTFILDGDDDGGCHGHTTSGNSDVFNCNSFASSIKTSLNSQNIDFSNITKDGNSHNRQHRRRQIYLNHHPTQQEIMDHMKQSSHEFSLLLQMMDQQSPPPTPIHPRAVWYKSATCRPITDGRYDDEFGGLGGEEERVRRMRITRPRLFQLIAEDTIDATGNKSCGGIVGRIPLEVSLDRVNSLDLKGMPPEIAALVRKEAGLLANHADGASNTTTRLKKQHTQQGQKQPNRQTPKRWVKYSVLAKTFILPWGDVLSVGCTNAQRFADEALFRGTFLRYGSSSFSSLSPRQSDQDDELNKKSAGGSSARSREYSSLQCAFPVCTFRWVCNDNDYDDFQNYDENCIKTTVIGGMPNKSSVPIRRKTKNIKKEILQMLHVASRGKFLSSTPLNFRTSISDDDNNEQENIYSNENDTQHLPFCAPWFHPTKEWFSLPFYLASRFEISLWHSFRRFKKHQQRQQQQLLSKAVLIFPRTMLEESLSSIPSDLVTKVFYRSVREAILGCLLVLGGDHGVLETPKGSVMNSHDRSHGRARHASDNTSFNCEMNLRDWILWRLLLPPSPSLYPPLLYAPNSRFLPFWKSNSYSLHLNDIAATSTVENKFTFLQNILSIPLIELGTAVDKFRLEIVSSFEETLSDEVGKALLQSSFVESNHRRDHKKKKSKKKKKKKRQHHPSLSRNLGTTLGAIDEGHSRESISDTPSPSNNASDSLIMPTSESDANGSDSKEESACQANPFGAVRTSAIPLPEERNRNTIVALAIIGDIINGTFAQLGIDTGSDEVDRDGNGYQTKLICHDLPLSSSSERRRFVSGAGSNNSARCHKEKKLTFPGLRKNCKDGVNSYISAPTTSSIATPIEQNSARDPSFDGANTKVGAQLNYKESDKVFMADNQLTMKRNNLTRAPYITGSIPRTWSKAVVKPSDHGRHFPPLSTTPSNQHYSQQCQDYNFSPVSSSSNAFLPLSDNLLEQHQQQQKGGSDPYHHDQIFSFIDPERQMYSGNHQSGSSIFETFVPSSSLGLLGSSLHLGSAFSEWGSIKPYQSRETSLFADFFEKEEPKGVCEDGEQQIASSTAASIASSSPASSGDESAMESPEKNEDREVLDSRLDKDNIMFEEEDSISINKVITGGERRISQSFSPNVNCDEIEIERSQTQLPANDFLNDSDTSRTFGLNEKRSASPPTDHSSQSPSPEEPPTPPPQLSPILVSLADIGEMRKQVESESTHQGNRFDLSPEEKKPSPVFFSESVPSSPKFSKRRTLTPSWSREDLRIPQFKDDHYVRSRRIRPLGSRNVDALLSYRNAAMKNLRRAASVCSNEHDTNEQLSSNTPAKIRKLSDTKKLTKSASSLNSSSKEVIIDGHLHFSTCAQSESALDANEDSSHWNVIPKLSGNDEMDNATTTRDGATTISSVPSPSDTDEIARVREERNAYCDMCLTLGAEVAKLKNMLASERGGSTSFLLAPYGTASSVEFGVTDSSYDPEFMPPFHHSFIKGSSYAHGAMSDAGIHHEATISEDGTMQGSVAATDVSGNPRLVNLNSAGHIRIMSTNGARAGSDAASLEHATVAHSGVNLSGPRLPNQHLIGPEHSNGLQSRLTRDINSFLSNISSQLKKQDKRRTLAIKRLGRLVTALWPRAQVKMYGSHVSNLCLPSSDLDFVICLPAVHKNAPADAPGVLEGRNAINESVLKLLARKLKSESWIDQRSIKIIERTVVPVIKVSTKDSRARAVQLDITFDAPEHHGLEAIEMVTSVMDEFPMTRPLVLVLKQFLQNRGLSTAYTGGLSSYCLFLMVTKYLQEQPLSWLDCGSLLMGFLDFYGNSFDPRSTGISVSRRHYFARSYYGQQPGVQTQHAVQQQMWSVPSPQQLIPNPSMGGSKELFRRHSFQTSEVMINPVHKSGSKSKRFQSSVRSSCHLYNPPLSSTQPLPIEPSSQTYPGRPFTFDPLFVEDPINPGNNIGRNSFRISSVKRAFSDAHRALVASLEWDMNSEFNEGGDYPLLKCLLHEDDTF